MSMTDTDKSSLNRGQPGLNVDDSLSQTVRMAHSTFGVTLIDEATGISSRLVVVDGKFEIYDSSNNLVARGGVRPADTEGAVDVAKPGQSL